VGSAHPKPNDIFFLNLCILIFKFINYLIDDLLLESKCFYRYIKTFPRRIFVRVDMSSLRGVRCNMKALRVLWLTVRNCERKRPK
jgi:hypothetical protein